MVFLSEWKRYATPEEKKEADDYDDVIHKLIKDLDKTTTVEEEENLEKEIQQYQAELKNFDEKMKEKYAPEMAKKEDYYWSYDKRLQEEKKEEEDELRNKQREEYRMKEQERLKKAMEEAQEENAKRNASDAKFHDVPESPHSSPPVSPLPDSERLQQEELENEVREQLREEVIKEKPHLRPRNENVFNAGNPQQSSSGKEEEQLKKDELEIERKKVRLEKEELETEQRRERVEEQEEQNEAQSEERGEESATAGSAGNAGKRKCSVCKKTVDKCDNCGKILGHHILCIDKGRIHCDTAECINEYDEKHQSSHSSGSSSSGGHSGQSPRKPLGFTFEKRPFFWFLVFFLIHLAAIVWMPSTIYAYIACAVFYLIVLPFFISDGTRWIQKVQNSTYIAVSIFEIALIWLAKTGPTIPYLKDITGFIVVAIILWIGAWSLFIVFSYYEGSKILRWVVLPFIIIVLILSFLWAIYGVIGSTSFANLQGADYGIVSLNSAMKTFGNFFSLSWSKLKEVPGSIADTANRTISAALGDPYAGQVEQNKNGNLGVFIDNVRPIDPILVSGQPITILADVSGQTFKDAITVTTSCVAKSSSGKFYPGTVDPAAPFQIVFKDTTTVYCTFPNLPVGTYKVQIASKFPFQSWAYIPYTFMDQETYRTYYAQGKDVNAELAIDKNPVAVFTSGPVSIGLQSQDQPIPIARDSDNTAKSFGATVSNRWGDGAIDKIDTFMLKIPQPITLSDDCKPLGAESSTINSDGYTDYVFRSIDPRAVFSSVTCRMSIKQADTAALLGSSVKSQKTFVALVNYTYVISKSIDITVK